MANLRMALRARLILIWGGGFSVPILKLLSLLRGAKVVWVATQDPGSKEYGVYCRLVWDYLMAPEDRARQIAKSRRRFEALAESIRAEDYKRAVVFGTGPSLEDACSFDFTDCLCIACNTIVLNQRLMEHIRPRIICAGDVVSHLGVSAYAHQFRTDLVKAMRERNLVFVTTANFGILFSMRYPELEKQIILIEQVGEEPNFDLFQRFQLPILDSTLNIHMLPIAGTFSKEIWFLGCDGKSEDRDNEDFWAHADQVQYRELVESGHKCHPTFDINRKSSTYARYLRSVETSVRQGEKAGITFGALRESRIPALQERSITKSALDSANLVPPYNLAKIRELLDASDVLP